VGIHSGKFGPLDGDGKPAFSEPGQSLFDAVQQYGLKLEARNAPMELLTVIHPEKTPTENLKSPEQVVC